MGSRCPDEDGQLRAEHGVPREGGQQEEVEKSRHRRTRPAIRLDVNVRVRNGVDFRVVDLHSGSALFCGVVDSDQESDDEGEETDADTHLHKCHILPLIASCFKAREVEK